MSYRETNYQPITPLKSLWSFVSYCLSGEFMTEDRWWENIGVATDDPRYVSVLKSEDK